MRFKVVLKSEKFIWTYAFAEIKNTLRETVVKSCNSKDKGKFG